MHSHESFLAEIESFLTRSGMSASAFGRAAVGDPNLVGDLRGGEGKEQRMPSLRLVERVHKFMANYRVPEKDAAA
jgi:hypothetical protein